MVFYREEKRQPRRAADGKITDLPDELLLSILTYLCPLDTLRFRLTCSTFAPAATSDITRRMKKIYVSPIPSSLLAAREICDHPAFSQNIEEVVILGCIPQRECFRVRSGPRGEMRREYGKYLTTWSQTFPTAKKVATIEDEGPVAGEKTFHDVYKPLITSLSTLPRLKKLSFAPIASPSGLNQVGQSRLKSFPKRHLEKPSAGCKRWSDGYAMFAFLSALGPQIELFEFCSFLAETNPDVLDAQAEFAPVLLGNLAVEKDEVVVRTPFFGVHEGNFLDMVRRYVWCDTAIPMHFLQSNGEVGNVGMICSEWEDRAYMRAMFQWPR